MDRCGRFAADDSQVRQAPSDAAMAAAPPPAPRIELMHMIRKGQLLLEGCIELSFADQFYALAGQIRPV